MLSVIKTNEEKCLNECFFYELIIFKQSKQLYRLQYVSGYESYKSVNSSELLQNDPYL